MIKGVHAMFYSSEPVALRAFFRDKMQLPCHDVGDGWLIFDFAEGDLGVHPLGFAGAPPTGTHAISFYCDDLEGTVDQLRARGVEFASEIEDHGFGLVIRLVLPGDVRVDLYEPKYTKS